MEELFAGCIFFVDLQGLQAVEVVQPLLGFIGRCGGHACQSLPDATHVVLWHQQQAAYGAALAASKAAVSPVWVYACLEAGKVLPTGHKLYLPFPAAGLPAVLEHPASYVGCISSFTGPNRWSALMLLACMGMRVTKSLTPVGEGRNTHLVVASVAENSDKAQAARSHNMHILNLRWPLDCLLEWRLLPEDAYTGDAADCSLVVSTTADPKPLVQAADLQADTAGPAHQAVPDSDNDSQGTGRAGTARDAQGPSGPSRLGPGDVAYPVQGAEAAGVKSAAHQQQQQGAELRRVLGHATAVAAGGAEIVIPSSTATGALSAMASPSTAALRSGDARPALAQLSGWRQQQPQQQQGAAGAVPAASPSPTYPAPAGVPPTARVPSTHKTGFPQQPSRLGRGPGSVHGDTVLAAAVEALARQEAGRSAGPEQQQQHEQQQQQVGAGALRAGAALEELQPGCAAAKPAGSGASRGSGRAMSGLSAGGTAKSRQDPSISNNGWLSQALGGVGNFLEGMGVFTEAQNPRLDNLADIFKLQPPATAAGGPGSAVQGAAAPAAPTAALVPAVGPSGASNGTRGIDRGRSDVAAVSGSGGGDAGKAPGVGGPPALPAAGGDDSDDTTPPVSPPRPASTAIVDDDHPPGPHQPSAAGAAAGVAGAAVGPGAGSSSKGGREQEDEATSPEKPTPQPPGVTLQHRHQEQQPQVVQQLLAPEASPDGLPQPVAGQVAPQGPLQVLQGRSRRSPSPAIPPGPHNDTSPPVGGAPLANPVLQRVRAAQRGTPSTGGSVQSGRSARSRSRSATPEPGSARQGRRKGNVERAPFSQQLPEANEKELKSLLKMMAKSEKDEEKLALQEARQLEGGEEGRAGTSGRGGRGRGRRGGRGGRGRGRGGSRQVSPAAAAAAAEPGVEKEAEQAVLAAHGGSPAAAEQPGVRDAAVAQERPRQEQQQPPEAGRGTLAAASLEATLPHRAGNAAAEVAAAALAQGEPASGVAEGVTSSSSGSDDDGQGAAGAFYSPVEELPRTVDGIVPPQPEPEAAQPSLAATKGGLQPPAGAPDYAHPAAAGPAALEQPAGDAHVVIAPVLPGTAPAAAAVPAAAGGAGAAPAQQSEYSDQGGLSAAAEQPDYGDGEYGGLEEDGGIGGRGGEARPAGDFRNSRLQEAPQGGVAALVAAGAAPAAAAAGAPLAPTRRSRKAASPRKLDAIPASPSKPSAAGNLPAELAGPANDLGEKGGHGLAGSLQQPAEEEDGAAPAPAAKRQKAASGKSKALMNVANGKAAGKRPQQLRQQTAAEVSGGGPGVVAGGEAAEEDEQQPPVGKRRKTAGTDGTGGVAEAGKGKSRPSTGRQPKQQKQQQQQQGDEANVQEPAQRSGRTRGGASVAAVGSAGAAGAAGARAASNACLALSGFSTKEQKELSAALVALKVKCVLGKRSHNWNPSVTHVVAPGLKRNQKCMAGLAAGLWLVGREYVAACSAAGDMVAPDDYELSEGLQGLISPGVAAHWRQRKEQLGVGAFHGLQVYVCEQLDEPAPTYLDTCNIIRAGGGRVLPQKNWRGASSSVDLAVAHSKSRPDSDALLAALVEAGALCVSSAFIVEWLAKPRASLEQHVLLGSECGRGGGSRGGKGNGKGKRGRGRQQGQEEHWVLAEARKRGSLDGSEVEYEDATGGWEGPPSPTL